MLSGSGSGLGSHSHSHSHSHSSSSLSLSKFGRFLTCFGVITSLTFAFFYIYQQGLFTQHLHSAQTLACSRYWSSPIASHDPSSPSSSSSASSSSSSSSSSPSLVYPLLSPSSSFVSEYGRTFGNGLNQYPGRILRHPEWNQLAPEIKEYFSQHSQHALISRGVLLSPAVCSLPTLISDCCGGNWGTGIFRLLTAIKLGMMLNRTVVHKGPSYFVGVFHVLSFSVLMEARVRMNCPPEDYYNVYFGNPHKYSGQFWQLSNHWLQDNCTNIHYPELVGDWSGVPADWESYRSLRCNNIYDSSVSILPPDRSLIRLHLGDQWQLIKLLEANPYYRTLNQLPPHHWNNRHTPTHFNTTQITHMAAIKTTSLLACELYRAIFRVDDDIVRVIETIMEGRPFDYYMHIRSVRGGTALQMTPRIIQHFNNQWKRWNDTHQNNSVVSVPHPPKRIYILLDYGNRTEICQHLEKGVPWLSCSFLCLSCYVSRYGVSLPLSLSFTFVSPSATGQGWGELPEWANIIDMFAVWGAEYGFTSAGSAYGRLLTFIGPDCNQNRAYNYLTGGVLEDSPYRVF